jgi:hypothetical protein
MRRSRAADVVMRVNSAGRIEYSPVQVEKWPHAVPRIPVTLGAKGRGETWAPHFITGGDVDAARRQERLNKGEAVCVVIFLDPDWGRDAHGAGGLFEVVRKSLQWERLRM